ncbi:MAG: AAA family ATPase [Prevotellaceae bacterium]|nr:AAA family ATPase [Prevotellaceae bacterium]
MMKRKIYDRLLEWKKYSHGETALIIEGARRVGKSYIVEEFAKREYSSYILIDFNNTTQQIKDLFVQYLNDLDTFFMYLSLYAGVKMERRQSLIIFDEVQNFPAARAAIKYLVKDGRYDFIETGSLVSIRKNVKGITVPSEEEPLQMYPMDFEEFLWAMGEQSLMDLIRMQFNRLKPVGQDMHRKAMMWFRQYMIVGGMPQAVQKYAETRDFEQSDRQKRIILSLYRNDIRQYADGQESKVVQIFDEIPAQLQRHERKFRLSDLKKDARYRDYDSAFFWLADAKVVNICYNSTEPNVGYKLTRDGNTLKCFMADTGLLVTHSFDENGKVNAELYRKLMLDKLELNGGMLMENIVAQMLMAAGHKLYFFSSYSKDDAASRMEIDFLVSKAITTSRHNVSPIEVKSGKNYSLSSLMKFRNKYGAMLHKTYVLHTSDVSIDNEIIYLPLYMTPLL